VTASRGGRTGSPSPEPYLGARRATPSPPRVADRVGGALLLAAGRAGNHTGPARLAEGTAP